MKLKTVCDMGSIKIFNDTISCFFSNNWGDGENIVEISNKNTKRDTRNYKFLGHFTVKTEAFLSAYDCEDEPIYTFTKGRWFVYLVKSTKFYISKVDDETHS